MQLLKRLSIALLSAAMMTAPVSAAPDLKGKTIIMSATASYLARGQRRSEAIATKVYFAETGRIFVFFGDAEGIILKGFDQDDFREVRENGRLIRQSTVVQDGAEIAVHTQRSIVDARARTYIILFFEVTGPDTCRIVRTYFSFQGDEGTVTRTRCNVRNGQP